MFANRLRIKAGILLLFIFIGLGIYYNALQNGFHYDDVHHIVRNPFIHTPANIPLFFTDPSTFSVQSTFHAHYRPLILTSYSLNYYFDGLNPAGYHLVNLFFHIGSAFLIFLILQAMLGGTFLPPLAGGLLFLVHPLNSEVINYITARSSVMCTFFYLFAFWFWVRYRLTNAYPKFFYSASLLTFLLAMLTKEIAITLPILLWLYDLVQARHSPALTPVRKAGKGSSFLDWRTYIPYVPFVLVGFLIGLLLRKILFGKITSTASISRDIFTHWLTEVTVWAKYILTMLVPAGLSMVHSIPRIDSPLNVRFLLSSALLIAVAVAAYKMFRSRDPVWSAGFFFVSWFFISLLPTSIVALTAPYQENRGYIAAVGFAGVMTILLQKGLTWPRLPLFFTRAITGLVVLVIAFYAAGVVKRNPDWRNTESLWLSVLRVYPQSEEAHNELGIARWEAGDMTRAVEMFQETLKINPRNSGALINLGILMLLQNETQKAEEYLQQAIKTNPYRPESYNPLGRIYESQGRFQEAARLYLMGYQYVPQSPLLARRLVDLYDRMGNLDEALKRFEQGAVEDPTNPTIHRALGWIYKKQGNRNKEIEALERVLTTKPDDLEALFGLREAYQKAGRWDQVEVMDRKAAALLPVKSSRTDQNSFVENRKLGLYYRLWGRYPEALEALQSSLKQAPKSPELPDLYNEIATVYFAMGRKVDAIASLENALAMNPSHWNSRSNLGFIFQSMGKTDLARTEYQKILQEGSPFGEDEGAYAFAQKQLDGMNAMTPKK